MRKLVLALALAASPALAAGDIVLHRDPGCGCCMQWAAQVRQAFGGAVRIVDDAARPAFQRRMGVPVELSSCHTAVIGGMAFEGHVPVADMRRLLASRPQGVRGLAVAGMPLGSPGMEVPGRRAQPFIVMAFGAGRPTVFARY